MTHKTLVFGGIQIAIMDVVTEAKLSKEKDFKKRSAILSFKLAHQRDKARPFRIFDKAKIITNLFGEEYESYDGGIASNCFSYNGAKHNVQNGREYYNGELLIKHFFDSYDNEVVSVYKAERFLKRMFLQSNNEIFIFHNQDLWLDRFNELYKEASDIEEICSN